MKRNVKVFGKFYVKSDIINWHILTMLDMVEGVVATTAMAREVVVVTIVRCSS